MPRQSQYQHAGNPLQSLLLPKQRPKLAFPYHPLTPKAESRLSRHVILGMVAISVAAIVCQLLQLPAQAGLARSFFITNTILVGIACFLLARLLKGESVAGLKELLIGLVVVFLYLNLSIPLEPHLLVLAASLSALTYLFGRHWIGYCAASPHSQASAAELSGVLNGFLLPMSAVPLGLYFLSPLLSWPQLVCLLAAIPVAQGVLLQIALDRGWKLSSAWSALHGWLSYNSPDADVPGIFQSPAGRWTTRIALTGWCVFLAATAVVRFPLERYAPVEAAAAPFTWFVVLLNPIPPATMQEHGLSFDSAIVWMLSVLMATLFPVLAVLLTPPALLLPLLINAAQFHRQNVTPEDWPVLTTEMTRSSDSIEQNCIYIGRIKCDGSPALIPRSIYREHVHFLGDSGSGKTARGLAPTVEQLIGNGQCSLIGIDLKGDSQELFAALLAGAERARRETGRKLPVKHFTNKMNRSTFAFNPLTQPFYRSLIHFIKTDIQCGALGLTYGADYGEGYYSSANAAVLYQTILQYPAITTYRELAERVGYVIANAKKSELHPEIRKAGVHVKTVLERLGSFDALNVSPDSGHPQEVIDNAIDLAEVFTEPQVLYFQLSSMIAPGSAPEIARLVVYSLLAAATQTQRRYPVFLVIDEFQRMVAGNLEYMLQLARSMGVGVILANQTMQDLRTARSNLIPTIETNCRYRQWFSVSAMEDRKRLIESSGETVEVEVTTTYGRNDRGPTESTTFSERVVPRLCENDVLLASDDPRQSILRISRGEGYAQYGGMPVIVESDFHITKEEYERRVGMPWPENVPGSFVPKTDDVSSSQAPAPPAPAQSDPAGPAFTNELINSAEKKPSNNGSKPAASPGQGLFEVLNENETDTRRRSRRKKTK